jgi:ABC-type transport system involved in cytochrome c biogenesis permease subunit
MLTKLLKPLSSLRLTVVLLALAMLLVYAGTWAQVTTSNWEVQQQYFYSSWVRVPLSTFFTRIADGGKSIPGVIYLPGGYTLGLALLINLIAAHALRFKTTWKDLWLIPGVILFALVYYLTRNAGGTTSAVVLALVSVPFLVALAVLHQKRTGVILIHLGLIMLLVGEGISSRMKIESRMDIAEGSYANYAYDVRVPELAIVDTSPADHDNVTVIPEDQLLKGGTVSHPSLRFAIKIDAYYENTRLLSPGEIKDAGPRATTGLAANRGYEARGTSKYAGAGENASRLDIPSAYITPVTQSGAPIRGTFLATRVPLRPELPQIDQPQPFEFEGKTYTLQLRAKRTYKPYTIYLKKFSFDRYTGTDVARNYSSEIRFVDPTHGEDRMVRIWMNHPLRYNGETFFQADFDHETEHGTVLQVVRNPAWRLPYVACVIGGVGLLVHFGIVLMSFTRKQSAAASRLPSLAAVGPATAGAPASKRRQTPERRKQSVVADSTRSPWRDLATPALVGLISIVYLIGLLFPHPRSGQFDVRTFAQLPVNENGRIQPWDSVARVTLRSLSGKDFAQMKVESGGTLVPVNGSEPFWVTTKKIPAADWLIDVLFDPEKAAEEYKPFRVDYPDLVGRLTTEAGQKYFSLNEILSRWDELAPQLAVAYDARSQEKTLSDYQAKLAQLGDRLRLYFKMAGPDNVPSYRAFHVQDKAFRQVLGLPEGRSLVSIGDIRDGGRAQLLMTLASDQDFPGISAEQIAPARAQARTLMDSIQVFQRMCPAQSLRIVPPQKPNGDWQSIEMASRAAEQSNGAVAPPITVTSYDTMRKAYQSHLPTQFNRAAAALYNDLDKQVPHHAEKARFEARFNSYDPFMQCIVFYVAALTLVCLSWLVWSKPLYRTAATLICVALVVHTAGLISRIYISGRPPVTNLTSASIFIAWGALILALGLEYFFRNSIGLLAASAAGFCSLLLSEGLTVTEGDTLKVLQAVLDTNFWLATHVVCVTLGYAATFLAGLLGIIYIVRGVFTTTLTQEEGRDLTRMTYGVVCFAMFFSFVGTVLGGIWADQSWGRFWGWDSKENGAVLVVLTNALLLHARWGGIVRERGVAVLAVWGIMVTQWSFFGTNQLGIGLHAYGFTEGLWSKLLLFWGIELVFILIGLLPLQYWAKYRAA